MSLVSLVKIQKAQFKKAILDSLRLIDYDFPHRVQNIVIKPNMCYYWDYSTGHTTDPKFVACLIDVLREQISPNVNIAVVESDASAMKCKHAFKMLGYDDLARRWKVSLVNLSQEKSEKIIARVGKYSLNLQVPQIIKNADLRINVPKIKYSMREIKISCALKNVFGCNPYPRKFVYHHRLEEVIVAVNKAMKFDLCIFDGNIVAGAQTRKLGLVMASTDPVALDSIAAHIVGVNPKTVRYLQLASREGLGKTAFIPRGVTWEYFGARFPRRGISSKFYSIAFDIVVRMHLDARLGLS
jgi:uncharacterized protein (DUF362 family)